MQPFDCLSKNCPLLGPHLLEASAGTGKTFAIEQIYVRLILESIPVEELLVVTFTRAATRELKARIRSNLEKTREALEASQAIWDYLEPYLGSESALRKLRDALAGFDRCQIFTIHGFCYRMLREFAFEAQIGAVADPDQERHVSHPLKRAALDFLEHGIDETLVCPEQISLALKPFASVEEIADRLLNSEQSATGLSFSELFERCKTALHNPGVPNEASSVGHCIAALHGWSGGLLEEEKLLADFRCLEKNYKAEVKGDFEAQVRALGSLHEPSSLRVLLKEKGSLFDFLDPANRKVRAQDPPFLHYPQFFEWARVHLAPWMKQKVFPLLQRAWTQVREKALAEEEIFDPDAILARMHQALKKEEFAGCVRKKYQAVMIDEFQDTDRTQWEIFQILFGKGSLKALYLVGDPKQSIYRFRKADIYTYLQARDALGESHVYQLDTNFRSSPQLMGALNALFARDWLSLPKVQRMLPYHPVKAGATLSSDFSDGKGAIHFFAAEGEPNALFEDPFLPFVVSEIERLELKKCAILVKDRYQAQSVLEDLRKRGIAAVAKSQIPLGRTVAFQAIRELFDGILNHRDASAIEIVKRGPFGPAELPFIEYKELLEKKGVVPLARQLADRLDPDGVQIFEQLFAWEREEGFSFEGLKRCLKRLSTLDLEEGARRRMEVDEEAVQIMTLHVSKGLEFDVVFALSLVSRTPAPEREEEEFNAEKLRQLYVAMTRAKKRLYVPVALSKKESDGSTHSPLELFAQTFPGSFLEELRALSQKESITIEEILAPYKLGAPREVDVPKKTELPLSVRSYTPSFLFSFTTLAKGKGMENRSMEVDAKEVSLQTMPRGPETGIAIHTLFEKLFTAAPSVWRDGGNGLDLWIEQQLLHSPLWPWREPIQKMVHTILSMPLQTAEEAFCLREVEEVQVEMEFVFSRPPDFIKGFIDLVFSYRGKIYFIDWKTNGLESYSEESLELAMQAHDYGLQASLYAEAIQRYFGGKFGGAFYVFIRGGTYKYVYTS